VTDLAPLAGFNASQANAVNSAGVVVGYSETPLGVTEATMWVNGTVVDLGLGIATDINDSNHVVGYSVDFTGSIITAHIWFNGTENDIGTQWLPEGINNPGLVVGPPLAFGGLAQQWDKKNGQRDIPGCGTALAVNDSGQIAGVATNGNATVCGMPDYGVLGAAVAINSSGQTVGYVNPSPDTANAALFPDTVLAQSGLATGINDLGWIVGETITSGGTNARTATVRPGQEAGTDWVSHWWNTRIVNRGRPDHSRLDAVAALAGQSHPFIWSQQSGLVALPDPLITAEGINGSMVVGAGLATDGTIHGFLLEGK